MSGSNEDEHHYDIVSINRALDELGMLSSITEGRKEYIREKECLRERLERLNMMDDQPGPSGFHSNPSSSVTVNPIKRLGRISASEPQKTATTPVKEKENTIFSGTIFSGLQVLTMNSDFITSFNSGYELPKPSSREGSGVKPVMKCSVARRRRLRTHPYDYTTVVGEKREVPRCTGYYRVRTTSLSSGSKQNQKTGGGGRTLVKSRSMENLSAAVEDSLSLSPRPKDLETVSKGIQQLKVEDCT